MVVVNDAVAAHGELRVERVEGLDGRFVEVTVQPENGEILYGRTARVSRNQPTMKPT